MFPYDLVGFFACRPLFWPLKLYPEQPFSLQHSQMKASPFFLHIDGVVARGDLHLSGMHCTL